MSDAGKYLVFRLGAEEYGFTIQKVREIIKLPGITPVPRTPDDVVGVMNLRGKVIPVISLRRKFDLEQAEPTRRTCVIVTEVSGATGPVILGVVVDEVSEVMEIRADVIEPPPAFGASVDTAFILGMGMCTNGVKVLVDMDRTLTIADAQALPCVAGP